LPATAPARPRRKSAAGVVSARKRQQTRFAHKRKITCNALMGPKELKDFCALDEATKELLKNAMADLN